MKRKASTIRDVAREANVSVATISHVFNNTRRVTLDTRRKVLEAAQRLNYVPSGIARSLSTRQTNIIGVVISDVTSPFNSMIIRGIGDRLEQKGYSLIIGDTDESAERESRHLQLLLERRVDGIVVASTGKPQPLFEEILQHNIGLLFVDRRPQEPLGPVVEIDNARAGYLAAEHLIGLGHRKIGLLTYDLALSTVRGRKEGYFQALRDYSIPTDPDLVKQVGINPEATDETIRSLLALPFPPTAIIAANHTITLGVLTSLQRSKIACPDTVSLIGFDDHPWVSVASPPLTMIRHPLNAICETVVATILSMISDYRQNQGLQAEKSRPHPGEYPDALLSPELVIRKSCKQLA